MTITEQLTDMVKEMDKPSKELNKLRLISVCATVMASMQDDSVKDVPVEAFEALGPDGRKMAVMGLTLIIMQTLTEEK